MIHAGHRAEGRGRGGTGGHRRGWDAGPCVGGDGGTNLVLLPLRRTRTRMPGRAKGWRRWPVTAPRAATRTSGCRTSVCRSAEPAPAGARLCTWRRRKKEEEEKKKIKRQEKEGETASYKPQTHTPTEFIFLFNRRGERSSPAAPVGMGRRRRAAAVPCRQPGGTLAGAHRSRARSRAWPRGAWDRAEEPWAGRCGEEMEPWSLGLFFFLFVCFVLASVTRGRRGLRRDELSLANCFCQGIKRSPALVPAAPVPVFALEPLGDPDPNLFQRFYSCTD